MTVIAEKVSVFVLSWMGLLGGLLGLIIGTANSSGTWGLILGSILAILVSFIGISFSQNETKVRYIICAVLVIASFYYLGPVGVFLGLFYRMVLWLVLILAFSSAL